jgi:hypothetical protein
VRGVAYVAIGQKAKAEAAESILALRDHDDLPLAVIGTTDYVDPMQGSRWAKLNIDKLVPKEWEQIAYLDADTRPRESISTGFEILDDGWDMVIVPSDHQGDDLLWHIDEEEREATLAQTFLPLQLQAGVFWFARNARTERLFSEWRKEWLRWKGQDQGAFLRALSRVPVRLWLLGFPWNGGAAIAHLFGRTR